MTQPERPLEPADVAVIRLVAAGHANAEIAALLKMPKETLRGRIRRLYRRVGISARGDGSRVLLVAWAYDHGVIEPGARHAAGLMPPAVPDDVAELLKLLDPLMEMAYMLVADRPLGQIRKAAERAVSLDKHRRFRKPAAR